MINEEAFEKWLATLNDEEAAIYGTPEFKKQYTRYTLLQDAAVSAVQQGLSRDEFLAEAEFSLYHGFGYVHGKQWHAKAREAGLLVTGDAKE